MSDQQLAGHRDDSDPSDAPRILLDTMFNVPGLEGVEEVVISKQVVEGTSPPLYIYGDHHTPDASTSA